MDLNQVLKQPIITEKSIQMTTLGKYTFRVDRRANKKEIARAVEKFFNVHVRNVKTITVRGKKKRNVRRRQESKRSDWKKAIVRLAEGEKIDIFETGE